MLQGQKQVHSLNKLVLTKLTIHNIQTIQGIILWQSQNYSTFLNTLTLYLRLNQILVLQISSHLFGILHCYQNGSVINPNLFMCNISYYGDFFLVTLLTFSQQQPTHLI